MRGFIFTETDSGTKAQCKQALKKTSRELSLEFRQAAREYWWRVWLTARQLCMEMAYDTGTLMNSIRLVWMVGYGGGPEAPFSGEVFDIAISSEGLGMTAMIKVGGEGFINPKTGWYVDYAQAVHDGTRYMEARPFLTLAITMNEAYLQHVLERHVDKALSAFERDY